MNKAAWIRLVIVAGAFGLLEFACRIGWLSERTIIAPTQMVASTVHLLTSGELLADIKRTFTSVGISIVLSIVLGFLVGFVLQWFAPVRRAVDPFLASYYAVPHFAFYPLLIVIFGLGALPLIVLATLFAMVAMIMATMTGLDRVPRVLLRTAKMHRMSPLEEMWRIRLPAAAPHLFSGVKLAVTYSFVAVIAGEFILSTVGIGHEIAYSYDNFDNKRMYGLILFVLGIVIVFNTAVHAYERVLAHRRGAI